MQTRYTIRRQSDQAARHVFVALDGLVIAGVVLIFWAISALWLWPTHYSITVLWPQTEQVERR